MKNNLEHLRERLRRAAEGVRHRCDALSPQQRRWTAADLLLALLTLNLFTSCRASSASRLLALLTLTLFTTLRDISSGRERLRGRIEHLHPVPLITDMTDSTSINSVCYGSDTTR